MKKILLMVGFVLTGISVFSQLGTFNNYTWSRTNRYGNQWGNNQWTNSNWNNQWVNTGWNNGWNNGWGNNNQWNNRWGNNNNNGFNNAGAYVAGAAITGLTQIITTAIIADAARDVLLEKEQTRQMQTGPQQSVTTSPQVPRKCYDEWMDANGNTWRSYHDCY